MFYVAEVILAISSFVFCVFDLSENGKYEGKLLWKMLIDFYLCVFVQDSFSHFKIQGVLPPRVGKGQRTEA